MPSSDRARSLRVAFRSLAILIVLIGSAGAARAGRGIAPTPWHPAHVAVPFAAGHGRRSLPPTRPAQRNDVAPGYCSGIGGSTEFEAITGVTLSQQPGNILHVQIDVFIANPTGCTAGNPCPEYDDSPEFVDAWIDWNGDGVWDPSETIVAQQGTGYLNINYFGTMTFVQDVPIPTGAVASTWLRAQLGWGFDPSDPCVGTWTWGNVFDRQVELPKVAVVQLDASGSTTPIQGVSNPVWHTTFGPTPQCNVNAPDTDRPCAGGFSGTGPALNVTLDACPSRPSYTPRVEYTWTVPSTAIPLADATGSGSFTGWTGSIPLALPAAVGRTSVELSFDIYNGSDKLVSGQKATVSTLYDGYDVAMAPVATPKQEWLDRATRWGQGGNTPAAVGSRLVSGIYGYGAWNYLDPAVAWSSLTGLGGAGNKGNCYTMSNLWDAMSRVLGVPGTGVSETKGSMGLGFVTAPGHAVSFDPAQAGNAHAQGAAIDRWMFGAHQVGSLAANYYDPTFNNLFTPLSSFILWNVTGAPASDGVGAYLPADGGHKIYLKAGSSPAKPWGEWEFRPATAPESPFVVATLVPARATSGLTGALSGPFTWTAVDANSDGQAEALRLSGTLVVTGPAGAYSDFNWVGTLSSGSALITMRSSASSMGIASGYVTHVGVGSYPFSIDFSGEDIRAAGLNGPWAASLYLHDETDALMAPLTTSSPALLASAFGERSSRISGMSDAGVDLDADGLFDQLGVNVEVQSASAGTVSASVAAYDSNGVFVTQGGASAAVAAGAGVVHVALDGPTLRVLAGRGPYTLSAQLADAGGTRLDGRTQTSAAYPANAFDPPRLAPSGGTSDVGQDLNGNGLFDDLAVNIPVQVRIAGRFQASATLAAGDSIVTTATWADSLPAGAQSLTLQFPGTSVRRRGFDGPYDVKNLVIGNPGGAVALRSADFYTTAAYSHLAFELPPPPLVAFAGSLTSSGIDANADGEFDSLMVSVPILPASSGTVVVSAFLSTPSGVLIAWSRGVASASAGVPVNVVIPFDGRLIYARGESGAYRLTYLDAYNTGDPSRDAQDAGPHATVAYDRLAFQPSPRVVGTVYSGARTPLAGASVYLTPTSDQTTSDAQGHFALMVDGPGGDPVQLTLQNPAGYTAASWNVYVNGALQGAATTYGFTPAMGETDSASFIYGSLLAAPPAGGTSRLEWLAPPSPNPVTAGRGAVLDFAVPDGSRIDAVIYDLNGRPVRSLLAGATVSGRRQLVWDGRASDGTRVAPGVYLVRIRARGGSGWRAELSGKLTLLR